ncbi:MAG TPA: archaeal heat shock protein Hsp20 [Candidatus Poseidoniia archaeon]|jgi:HSP20 family protein|nr:archaeal heat shock protein Hsp20 [Candidatus Poseidoniia archaeon]
MNRKRKGDADDWFRRGEWSIEDIFSNLDTEFSKMRKQMDGLMRDAVDGNLPENAKKNPFVFGFSVKAGPDGFPVFEDFGNTRMRPFDRQGEKPVVDTRREPLTDINETDNQIAITVELPGVNKEDIDINVMEDKVEVTVKTESRKFFKSIDLSSPVETDSSKATYTNGILDLVLTKKESDEPKGTKVKVD